MRNTACFVLSLILVLATATLTNAQSDEYAIQGKLTVQFDDDVRVIIENHQLRTSSSLNQAQIDELNTLGSWRRFITKLTEQEVRRMEVQAEEKSNQNISNLYNLIELTFDSSYEADELIRRLSNYEFVSYCRKSYISSTPNPGDYEEDQDYIDSGLVGVEADEVWEEYDNRGNGIKIVDIEQAANVNHIDLPNVDVMDNMPSLIFNVNNAHHGTCVLGVLGSMDNGWGTTGIASDADLGFYPVQPNIDAIAEGIMQAASQLNEGDIIIIEQHIPGPYANGNGQWGFVPVEYFKSCYDAIFMASQQGIIIVEAAGNGSQDLDFGLNRNGDEGHQPFDNDSGAILVGAGGATASTYRSRLDFSNFGNRVDLQGNGHWVVTTAYKLTESDLYNSGILNVNDRYTAKFGGTSSASPIVAGAVALLNSTYEEHTGDYLTRDEIVDYLQATGKSQRGTVNPISQNIGPLPDVYAALQFLLEDTNEGCDNPSTPDGYSPGYQSSPGEIIYTTTPTLEWETVSGAGNYEIFINKSPYGNQNIIYENCVGNPPFTIPSGVLEEGQIYRWNVQALNDCSETCESGYSDVLYFQTSTSSGGNSGNLACNNINVISCETTVSGTTIGQPNNVENYGCVGVDLDGGEKVYQFTLSEPSSMVAFLQYNDPTTYDNPLDILLLDACDQSTCIAYDDFAIEDQGLAPGTYYLVVDGRYGYSLDYTLTLWCVPLNDNGGSTGNGELDCDGAFTYACGASDNRDMDEDGTDNVSRYGNYDGYTGKEIVYELYLEEPMYFKATLTYTSHSYLDIFLLDGCNPDYILDEADNRVSTEISSPTTVYVVIDGWNGVNGSFDIEFECELFNQNDDLECNSPVQIQCGVPYNGNTNSGDSNVSFYGMSNNINYGCTDWEETGPEVVHEFTLNYESDLHISLTNTGNETLDMFLINVCDADEVLVCGYEYMEYENALPGDYYLVVDGYEGDAGSYTLEVECSEYLPTIPILTSPSNASNINGTSAFFSWLSSENATGYDIQIATDYQFNNIIQGQDVNLATTYNYNSLSNDGTVYYWRVRAYNDTTNGGWSLPFYFKNNQNSGVYSGNFTTELSYPSIDETSVFVFKSFETPNGSSVVFFNMNPYTGSYNKIAIAVIDETGELINSMILDEANTGHLEIIDCKQLADNGYIILTGFEFDTNASNVGIIRLDSNLNIIWTKKISYPIDTPHTLTLGQIYEANDGGFFMRSAGMHGNIFKLDSSGNIEWAKTYEEIGQGATRMVFNGTNILLFDGELDGMDFLKLDFNGNILLSKKYCYPVVYNNPYESIRHMVESDGYLYVGSGIYNQAGPYTNASGENIRITKIDYDGNIFWSKMIGQYLPTWFTIHGAFESDNNGNLITTIIDQDEVLYDNLTLLINPSGNIIWSKEYLNGGYSCSSVGDNFYAFRSLVYPYSYPHNRIQIMKADMDGNSDCGAVDFQNFLVDAPPLIPCTNSITASTITETATITNIPISVISDGTSQVICSQSEVTISGNLTTDSGLPISGAEVIVSSSEDCTTNTGTSGEYSCLDLSNGANYTITPSKNTNIDNGIDIQDAVIIQNHVDGILPLQSPYKVIAADVNEDMNVTAIDANVIQQYAIGNITTYPSLESWAFVPESYTFSNPSNPFPYPNDIQLTNVSEDVSDQDFIGIKIGDMNESVIPAGFEGNAYVDLVVQDTSYIVGSTVTIPFKVRNFNTKKGFQIGMRIDPNYLNYLSISAADLPGLSFTNAHINGLGEMRIGWVSGTPAGDYMAYDEIGFNITVEVIRDFDLLSDVIRLESHIWESLAYNTDVTSEPIRLKFLWRETPLQEACPPIMSAVDTFICDGDFILLGGEYQTSAGIYMDVLATPQGCDSTVLTTLTTQATYQIVIDTVLAVGETVFAGGAQQGNAGSYHDDYISQYGCDSIIITHITVIDNITQLYDLYGLSIFPNPNNGIFNISFDKLNGSEIGIKIMDVNGRLIEENIVSAASGNFNHILNMADQPSGVYFVQITVDGIMGTEKIVLME